MNDPMQAILWWHFIQGYLPGVTQTRRAGQSIGRIRLARLTETSASSLRPFVAATVTARQPGAAPVVARLRLDFLHGPTGTMSLSAFPIRAHGS